MWKIFCVAVAGWSMVGMVRERFINRETQLDERGVRRVLAVLEQLELIWRERNFAAPAKAPWRTGIADHAVRFWYRFVGPHRSLLARG